ncbi:hypothetical protein JXB41_02155 [Candidatus Woesearchaeota archaeon]|nr:hypothetical protein [Candidatus Woesearchaeota archaeon]
MANGVDSVRQNWVKLVFSETPSKAVVKQGYLFDEGDFYKIVGDKTETFVRKIKVISITKKRNYDTRVRRARTYSADSFEIKNFLRKSKNEVKEDD